jgi:dTDP-4-amino-4,6-dideoxygalactose transaminase
MARRYFYPLISEFPMYRGLPSAQAGLLPVAKSVSSKVICLPLYPSLTDEDVQRVADLIRQSAHQPEPAHP